MVQMEWLKSTDRFDELWTGSDNEPVFLLKHSTTCPISSDAYKDFLEVEEAAAGKGFKVIAVKVIEDRPVSRHIADVTGIEHQSPQVMIIRGRQVVWHTSHFDIHTEKLLRKIDKY